MCKQNSVAKYMCATVGDPQPVARKEKERRQGTEEAGSQKGYINVIRSIKSPSLQESDGN